MPQQSPRLGASTKKRVTKQLKPKYASAEYKNLYDWQWRKASEAYRKENPLCVCEECAKRVVPRPAEVVDHIKPHKGDKVLFWNIDNWQAMAKKCHDRKTVLEDGGFKGSNGGEILK